MHALQLLNEALNTALKHWIKQPRPVALLRHHLGSYGMPSDHSQFMMFATAYVVLFAVFCWGQPGWARAGWALGSIVLALSVCLSRVYLLYHTPSQVVVGAVIGIITGTVWFAVTEAFLVPLFAAIERHWMARYFLVRDCTSCADVLSAEYVATSSSQARQRNGKGRKSASRAGEPGFPSNASQTHVTEGGARRRVV